MNIKLIIYTIIVLFIGGEIGYHLFYSPKATIRRLLKKMYKLPIKYKGMERQAQDKDNVYYNRCKELMNQTNKTINDMLNIKYYFDPKEDKEYIEKKKQWAQSLLSNLEEIFRK